MQKSHAGDEQEKRAAQHARAMDTEDSPSLEILGISPQGSRQSSPDRVEAKEMDTGDSVFHLAQSDEVEIEEPPETPSAEKKTPRSGSVKEKQKRPAVRPSSGKVSSSIPLPVKSPQKSPSNQSALSRTSHRPMKSSSSTGKNTVVNKRTLEVQFLNKKRRLNQLKLELVEKQKPIMELYQSLVQIKRKLEELGKTVVLEEVKLIPLGMEEEIKKKKAPDLGGGEEVSVEHQEQMRSSIEEIPKTLMGICQNLLGRRAAIVELLESVAKAEVDVSEISDKIESMKAEGEDLQKSLDAIISEHEHKIKDLMKNWQKVMSESQDETKSGKIEELQWKLEEQEKLVRDSNALIADLQKKLEDKRNLHEKSVNDLDSVIKGLKEQIKKLEGEVESERKQSFDLKTRTTVNNQAMKVLKSKIVELETKSKESEDKNADLNKKLRFLQEQLKSKEIAWFKEKEELNKSLKDQELNLQKLTADRNQFETRFKNVAEESCRTSETLQLDLQAVQAELQETKEKLQSTENERDILSRKFKDMQVCIQKLGLENKEDMQKLSSSINWGKNVPENEKVTDEYAASLANQILLREYEDKVRKLEIASQTQKASTQFHPLDGEATVFKHQECISRYQQLLEESEDKLREKSLEVAKLTSEIRHLKVRQDALEEQNHNCPTIDLQKMVEEGRAKLNELMKKSLESEQRIVHYEAVIDKQNKQMNEMENLLRYRENMTGVLKAARDELMLEKDSLTRYSQEMRSVLADVTKEGKMKDRVIKELQDKLELREKQISKLEKEVKDLEANLIMTNEKRFRLQETIGAMEKELQATKAQVSQLADMQTRYEKACDSAQGLERDCKANQCCNSHSESLINLSLEKVDFLKTRLNFLTKKMGKLSEGVVFEADEDVDGFKSESDSSIDSYKSQGNFEKLLELTAKRYELFQKEAYESYEELTKLMKMSLPGKLKKSSGYFHRIFKRKSSKDFLSAYNVLKNHLDNKSTSKNNFNGSLYRESGHVSSRCSTK